MFAVSSLSSGRTVGTAGARHGAGTQLQRNGDLDRETTARARQATSRTRATTTSPALASRRLRGSADPAYRGDAGRHNPEDLLVAALSACHMLWYLHLCSAAGVVVTAYEDSADGVMQTHPPGGEGEFTRVTLRPRVTITPESDAETAARLHAAGQRQLLRRPLGQLPGGSPGDDREGLVENLHGTIAGRGPDYSRRPSTIITNAGSTNRIERVEKVRPPNMLTTKGTNPISSSPRS